MTIDPGILATLLALVGGAILTGIGFILKTLNSQNQALAVLVDRVGTYNMGSFDTRLVALEADMVRVWKIYDEAKNMTIPSGPSATETLARMH